MNKENKEKHGWYTPKEKKTYVYRHINVKDVWCDSAGEDQSMTENPLSQISQL